MTTSRARRINELREELDRAIDQRDMVAIRLTSIELRELERKQEMDLDIKLARAMIASREVFTTSLN